MHQTPITLIEVGPRDGLQNEPEIFSLEQKLELVNHAIHAGLQRIEAVSFVNPGRVPQMADAEELMRVVPRPDHVRYSGLALNLRGAQRAVDAGVHEINYVVVATDSYNHANQGCPTLDTLSAWEQVAELAHRHDIGCTLTIAASFGCPFEGEVPIERITQIAKKAIELGANELVLADSIGVASPADVTARIAAVRQAVPGATLRCHFHNTRNTGLANVVAAMQSGVTLFDSAIGGIGGCPFAPGATGNIPTEDVAYMLDRMGVLNDVSLDALIEAGQWLSSVLDRPVPGMLSRAGKFPRAAND